MSGFDEMPLCEKLALSRHEKDVDGRAAVIEVVSALRRYRAASLEMLKVQNLEGYGTADSVAERRFLGEVAGIEADIRGPDFWYTDLLEPDAEISTS